MSDENQTSQDDQASQNDQTNKARDPQNQNDQNDFEEKYLRALADLENYRQQVEREKTELVKFANENLITQLLPILDNFQRAAAHLPEDLKNNKWINGITGIEKQFEQTLENLSLKKIKPELGNFCDANKHEIIAVGEGEKDTILEIFEEGYELNGKILRAAKVKVGTEVSNKQ
jgi:molecular chaperone GrpE